MQECAPVVQQRGGHLFSPCLLFFELGVACVSAGGVDKPGIALVPVGDLLDHDNSRHVGWHTGPLGTDSFHFLNYAPIKKVHATQLPNYNIW